MNLISDEEITASTIIPSATNSLSGVVVLSIKAKDTCKIVMFDDNGSVISSFPLD